MSFGGCECWETIRVHHIGNGGNGPVLWHWQLYNGGTHQGHSHRVIPSLRLERCIDSWVCRRQCWLAAFGRNSYLRLAKFCGDGGQAFQLHCQRSRRNIAVHWHWHFSSG